MTKTDIAGICERLRAIATASFETNKSFGRKGKEWAIETEVEWRAAHLLERQAADIKRMQDALKLAVDLVDRDVIRVRPTERSELLDALGKWNAALVGEDA